MIEIPKQYDSLKYIGPVDWDYIFSKWREGEENQESWKEHWSKRGFNSWEEWRKNYASAIYPEKLEWHLFEIKNPEKIVLLIYGVPSCGWIKKAYNGETTKQLKDIAYMPIISENEKVSGIMNNFPKKTMLTAVLHKGKIVLIEGMHRANALANWSLPEKPDSKVQIAIARWDEDELPRLGSGRG